MGRLNRRAILNASGRLGSYGGTQRPLVLAGHSRGAALAGGFAAQYAATASDADDRNRRRKSRTVWLLRPTNCRIVPRRSRATNSSGNSGNRCGLPRTHTLLTGTNHSSRPSSSRSRFSAANRASRRDLALMYSTSRVSVTWSTHCSLYAGAARMPAMCASSTSVGSGAGNGARDGRHGLRPHRIR